MLTTREIWQRWENRSDGNLPPLITDGWYAPPDIKEVNGHVGYRYDLRGGKTPQAD